MMDSGDMIGQGCDLLHYAPSRQSAWERPTVMSVSLLYVLLPGHGFELTLVQKMKRGILKIY